VASVAEDLKRVPLFSELSQRQLRQLAKNFSERLVPTGAQLAKQNEMSGVAFFVIADGEAAVIVDGRRGFCSKSRAGTRRGPKRHRLRASPPGAVRHRCARSSC